MERFLYGCLGLVLLVSCGGRKGGSAAATDVDEDGGTDASETYETQEDLSGFIFGGTIKPGHSQNLSLQRHSPTRLSRMHLLPYHQRTLASPAHLQP